MKLWARLKIAEKWEEKEKEKELWVWWKEGGGLINWQREEQGMGHSDRGESEGDTEMGPHLFNFSFFSLGVFVYSPITDISLQYYP